MKRNQDARPPNNARAPVEVSIPSGQVMRQVRTPSSYALGARMALLGAGTCISPRIADAVTVPLVVAWDQHVAMIAPELIRNGATGLEVQEPNRDIIEGSNAVGLVLSLRVICGADPAYWKVLIRAPGMDSGRDVRPARLAGTMLW